MSAKSSRISLYSSDALNEKGLHLMALDAKSSITSPNPFEISATVVSISGQTVDTNDILDLGQKISDMVSLQASDNLTLAAGISNNLTAISGLTTTQGADNTVLLSHLQAEVQRAVTAELVLQTNINSVAVRARADAASNAAGIVTERNRAVTEETKLETDYKAADAGLQGQIDALGVVDATTLASINNMLSTFGEADNSVMNMITELAGRVSTLEDQVATLTA